MRIRHCRQSGFFIIAARFLVNLSPLYIIRKYRSPATYSVRLQSGCFFKFYDGERRRVRSTRVERQRKSSEKNVAREKSVRKEKQNPVKSYHFVITDAESKRNRIPLPFPPLPPHAALFSVWIFFFYHLIFAYMESREIMFDVFSFSRRRHLQYNKSRMSQTQMCTTLSTIMIIILHPG